MIATSLLLLPMTTAAERGAPLPGDENFLADADAAAETGTDFSYARVWGERRAYDGTDTSRYFAEPETPQPQASAVLKPQPSPQAQSSLITRAAGNAAQAESTGQRRVQLRGFLRD